MSDGVLRDQFGSEILNNCPDHDIEVGDLVMQFEIAPCERFQPDARACQEFRVWAGSLTLRRHGFDEALAEDDGELGLGHGPFTGRHFPLFLR